NESSYDYLRSPTPLRIRDYFQASAYLPSEESPHMRTSDDLQVNTLMSPSIQAQETSRTPTAPSRNPLRWRLPIVNSSTPTRGNHIATPNRRPAPYRVRFHESNTSSPLPDSPNNPFL